MVRLPQPGGDDGEWGGILNEFLEVSHTQTGALKNGSVPTDVIQDDAITVAKIATTSNPSAGQVLTYTGGALAWGDAPVGSVPDATSSVKGAVQLTGDLGGTAASPTVPGLAGKANTSHTHAAADITSGTLAAARLPGATESTAGAVQLASTSEVVTGTDTVKAVTAAGVSAAITAVANPVIFVDSLEDIPHGTPVDTLVIVRAA